ncbi:MAG: hypothetical protein J5903_02095 [Clostridia bacterium]|nr:hypothetical protein [Clostridia bacterium]
MNKIELLKTRREKLLGAGDEIRKKISELVDENSFVELDAYSFSANDFYDEGAEGEGVVTGYATLCDTPVYVVAQNAKVFNGGISYGNCRKIKNCLDKAYQTGYPVIYLFDSLGVRVGEGVNALEGMADVISAAHELKGSAPQFSVVLGKLYGTFALLAANADFNFTLKDSLLCYASPFVLSAASGKNLKAEEVAGQSAYAKNGLSTVAVEDLGEVKEKISEILGILPAYSGAIDDTSDDLNRTAENLNEKVCPKCVINAVFDDGKFIEMNGTFCADVKTGIGRIGGISAAALIFGGDENGVALDAENVIKIKKFAEFAAENSLPLVTFVNTVGIKQDLSVGNSPVLHEICSLVGALKACDRLSVVYGKAIGLGYTLFAAKSSGVEYSYAFATAKIGLFDGKVSAVQFGEISEDKLDALAERYSDENADPVNAAKNGFIDNIIEPQFVRAYVVSALQMIVR